MAMFKAFKAVTATSIFDSARASVEAVMDAVGRGGEGVAASVEMPILRVKSI